MMRNEGSQIAINQLNALVHCEIEFNRLNEIICPILLTK